MPLSLALAGAAAEAAAQESACRGWTRSCASVEVSAYGDRLVLFVPNHGGFASDVAPEADGAGAVSGGQRGGRDRLRMYTDAEGLDCDPLSGIGCVEVRPGTIGRLEPVEPTPSGGGSPVGTAGAASSDDAGADGCVERGGRTGRTDRARVGVGVAGDEERECRDRPIVAYFVIALPASLFLFGPDEDGPVGTRPIPGGGESAGPETQGGAGGETDWSGDDDPDGSPGPTDPENRSDGWKTPAGPPGPSGPPRSEMPEPVGTTLFGLGLLGYAGTKLRKRLPDGGGPEPDGMG